MTKEFSSKAAVDGTYPGMPGLTKQGNMERMPPEQEDGEGPQRPTSCPTLCPSVLLYHDEGIRLEGDPELSVWTQG